MESRLFSPFGQDLRKSDAVRWSKAAFVCVQTILCACSRILASGSLRRQRTGATYRYAAPPVAVAAQSQVCSEYLQRKI